MSQAPVLDVAGVVKRFGGFTALDGINLTVAPSERLGLIGPNGSGKTTLISCISGSLIADEGQVRFQDQDITKLTPHRRTGLGIGRSFQIPRPFGSMTVAENVAIPLEYVGRGSRKEIASEARDILGLMRLDHLADTDARALNQIELRKLELARAMACHPKLLISDEAMAGLSGNEVDEILEILLAVNQRGVAIIMIEHIMRAVMGFSERIVVLDAGKKIADGAPADIMRNPDVERAYLASRIVAENLSACYGAVQVLHEVSLRVESGETVVLLGTNGNGKSTMIKCLTGIIQPTSGSIYLERDGERINLAGRSPQEIVNLGVALVPEGRRLFPKLTVTENLELGAFRPAARERLKENLAFCFEAFPRLAERRHQMAGSMSGGEQQMVALARAMMSDPQVLLIDEPSVGLAPILVSRMIEKIKELHDHRALTVLMAEQNFNQAIKIADRGYIIVHGEIAFEGESADSLKNNEMVKQLYLGA